MKYPLFNLGRTVITPGAQAALKENDIIEAMRRYIAGDWGDLCSTDRKTNDEALVFGNRILAAYKSGQTKFWIITEWDRSITTILLPEEY